MSQRTGSSYVTTSIPYVNASPHLDPFSFKIRP